MASETQVSGRQSRVGKRPIAVPKGVTVNVAGDKLDVQGPKGKLNMVLPSTVSVTQEKDVLVVSSSAPGGDGPRWQGLSRALIANMVRGVAQGFERTLELVGTGYRGEIKGGALHLSLGLSHPVVFPLPAGVKADIPAESKGTIINLSSPDKAVLGQACATIRSFRPPEPYAGKGVRYRGEHIRRKAGKAGKK